jgi:hypothetical protein
VAALESLEVVTLPPLDSPEEADLPLSEVPDDEGVLSLLESPAAEGLLLLSDLLDEDEADAADFLSAAASVFLLLA